MKHRRTVNYVKLHPFSNVKFKNEKYTGCFILNNRV